MSTSFFNSEPAKLGQYNLPNITPPRQNRRVFYRFKRMVNKPLIIHLKPRKRLFWGANIIPASEIVNRHRLSPIVQRFAIATPIKASFLKVTNIENRGDL